MIDKKEQFNSEFEPEIPARLKADLGALFKPIHPVPAELDRAVIDRTYRHLLTRQRRWYRAIRWAGSVAAAAAIIIFACVFFNLDHSTNGADIDHNGRVDILDAFKLARQIESSNVQNKKLDFNGDGVVNQEDVDVVALAAVHLD
jgi:hypothetical protein